MEKYSGPVRILDSSGVLLTVGSADLEPRPETGSWGGILRLIPRTGVAGKALHVRLDMGEGRVGDATLDPLPTTDGVAFSEVAGMGPAPF